MTRTTDGDSGGAGELSSDLGRGDGMIDIEGYQEARDGEDIVGGG